MKGEWDLKASLQHTCPAMHPDEAGIGPWKGALVSNSHLGTTWTGAIPEYNKVQGVL